MEKADKKKFAILDILNNSEGPMSSTALANTMNAQGMDVSERTVRLYLKEFDKMGYTTCVGRKGRVIAPAGVQESQMSRAMQRVGYLSGKIDVMAYRMTFNPDTCQGEVVVNVSVIPLQEFTVSRRKMFSRVFAKKYTMGRLIGLFAPGSMCMGTVIPERCVGLCTICSITFNGLLRREGIPVSSRFGGLLEIRDGRPERFVEVINYDGTTIDPLAIFIRAGMANCLGAINDDNGLIGASIREFPAESVSTVRMVGDRMQGLGLGNLVCVGNPGQSVFDFQVTPERAAAVVVGGLNPVSVFVETGVPVLSTTLAGVLPYEDLFPFNELDERLYRLSRSA